MRYPIYILLSFFIFLYSITQGKTTIPFYTDDTNWADSVMSTMTLEERIGQLLMVTTYPQQGKTNEQQIAAWIKNNHIGGVLFLKNSPHDLALRTNQYQALSKIPLFIALDAENGLSMRLDSVVSYPHLIGLGSLANDSLIYRMGREVGKQCRMLGVNVNFAPVADVNTNPNNPIINYRSFGQNPHRVAAKTWLYAKGMQDENIIVSAKHFPGHGDTSYDSHLTLPVVNRPYSDLVKSDFVPFKMAIDSGISGIMTAHINMSEIDNKGLPATLSENVMTHILRDSLGFEGLVFSDGMNMKGITKYYSEGQAAVKALKAGVDVIEFILDPQTVTTAIIKALKTGELTNKQIDEKCRKVLLAKKWLGLNKAIPVDMDNLTKRLNKPEFVLTSNLLYQQSITVVHADSAFLPLQRLDTLKVASLAIGENELTSFQQTLEKYTEVDHFFIGAGATNQQIDKVLAQIKTKYNLVIAGIYGTSMLARNNYQVAAYHQYAVEKFASNTHSVFSFFTNPYALSCFNEIEQSKAALITYGDNYLSQTYAAQLIFGAISARSTLPVSINQKYPEGHGVYIKKNNRFKYTIPEEVGFDSGLLHHTIDSFAVEGIQQKMFPGCQVLLAKNGKVFFHEAYGFHTYDSLRILKTTDVYDLASLSKVIGPLPVIMKMTEDSLLKLDEPFCKYWPAFSQSDKEKITLREILTHQAGFKPWVAFYSNVTSNGRKYRETIVRKNPSQMFSRRISSSMYIRNDYKYYIMDYVASEKLRKKKKYAYSDLGFLLFPDLITNFLHVDYEKYLTENIYALLGIHTIKYNPYRFFETERFVPTELDDKFRCELLQGFVHDETAAMMGGVSGNAGLFSTTNDLAKMMQFYLNQGTYGDFCYLKPQTVDLYTDIQFPENDNRRGLGFDKPYIDNDKNVECIKKAYPAPAVSTRSFGHSGYTGCFVWSDPENQLLFVFMSNRVFPSRENTLISSSSFRPKLQQAIYSIQNTFTY